MLAASDRIGAAGAQTIPVSLSIPGEVTLETGGRLNAPVVLNNSSDNGVSAEVEFLVQQDPTLYSKPAPNPLYGEDVASGCHSWGELNGQALIESNDVWGRSNGKVTGIDAMTDRKPWTSFGTPWNDKEKWSETFGYIDLGKSLRVVHMGYELADPRMAWKVDFAASADGKQYIPVEGLTGIDIHLKSGPQEIDVPTPFEARFIRMRLNTDGGERTTAFRYPAEFHVFAGATEQTWAFPQIGPMVVQGKQDLSIPAAGSATVTIGGTGWANREIGAPRALRPGAYLLAVRVRAAGLTQMRYCRVFVMPPPMGKVSPSSRFGLNVSDPKYLSLLRRQGCSSVRYDGLQWPLVSPAAGVYQFDGVGDSILAAYHQASLAVLPCLFGTPGYLLPAKHQGESATNPPTGPGKYGEFVFQTVARYGANKQPADSLLTADRVSGLGYADTYELWSEPNPNNRGISQWKGSLEDYYRLFRIGAEAARKADPNVKIANGGWWGLEIPVMETMKTFRYPDGKCPLDFTDILSVHYFSPLFDVGSAYGIEPELASVYDISHHHEGLPFERTVEQDLRSLVAWRDANKPGMPIWMTEGGWDSCGVSEYLQACWLPRGVMMSLAAGIDRVQVFHEKDGPGGGDFASSGLIRKDDTLKPAWFTYATLIRQLDGVSGSALRIPSGDDNVRVYLWKRGNRPILTAWAIKGAGRWNAALGRCTLTDAFGASHAVSLRGPMELTVFPVYISNLADPSVVRSMESQAIAAARDEQQRAERQARLRAYLFKFGRKQGEAVMAIGKLRHFTLVPTSELYDEAKGYGFEVGNGTDMVESWFQNPISADAAKAWPGMRFIFKAEPGAYQLRLCCQSADKATVILHGLDGGDRVLPVDGRGLISIAAIKVGAKPVTLETSYYGGLSWMALVQADGGQ